MKFISSLWGLVRAHPLMFVLFIFLVVLTLGGLVWFVIGKLLGLIGKVSPGAAAAAEGAVAKVATATKSA